MKRKRNVKNIGMDNYVRYKLLSYIYIFVSMSNCSCEVRHFTRPLESKSKESFFKQKIIIKKEERKNRGSKECKGTIHVPMHKIILFLVK